MPFENPEKEKMLGDFLANMEKEPIKQKECEDYYLIIKEIYSDGYRHNYSFFYKALDPLFSSSDLDSLHILSENIDNLYDYIDENHTKDPCLENFQKLCDHIHLEISRYFYFKKNIFDHENKEEWSQTITDLDSRVACLEDTRVTTEAEYKKTLDEIQKNMGK